MNLISSSSTMEDEPRARLAARIRECAAKAGSGDKLAQITGIQRRTLENYLSGKSEPKALTVSEIAKAVGVSLRWLIEGVETKEQTGDANSLSIKRYDVAVSAGSGAFPGEALQLEPVSFDKDFFSTRLSGRKPDAMIVVDARGDSMAPVIGDGDLVMIDTDDTTLLDAIYALSLNDELYVKRVVRHPDRIELLSDNPSYPPTIIPRSDIDDVKVIGRVVWIGHNLVGPA